MKRPVAFWKTGSTPPYYACDEVLEFMDNDKAMVKRSYGNLIIKPISIVPYKEGLEIKKQLDLIAEEYRIKTLELSNLMMEKASNLVVPNYPRKKKE